VIFMLGEHGCRWRSDGSIWSAVWLTGGCVTYEMYESSTFHYSLHEKSAKPPTRYVFSPFTQQQSPPSLFPSQQASFTSLPLPTLPHLQEKLTINAQLAMPHHLLNLPLLLQIIQRLPRQTAIDLQAIDERGDGDEAVRLHVFVEFVRGGFVEDDGVVGLVLDCEVGKRKDSVGRWYLRRGDMGCRCLLRVGVRTFAFGPLLLLLLAGRCCCWCLRILSVLFVSAILCSGFPHHDRDYSKMR